MSIKFLSSAAETIGAKSEIYLNKINNLSKKYTYTF